MNPIITATFEDKTYCVVTDYGHIVQEGDLLRDEADDEVFEVRAFGRICRDPYARMYADLFGQIVRCGGSPHRPVGALAYIGLAVVNCRLAEINDE